MKMLFVFLLILQNSWAHETGLEWYPEERDYTEADRGLRPYRALSLYQTGRFALTFDDGPDPIRTPLILDTLKKFGKKATFFVLTNRLTEDTFPLIRRMLDEGHIVASHGPTHDRSGDLTKDEWKRQTKQSFLDLAQWYRRAGHPFTKFYYRFPFGDYGTRHDYHHINALKEVSHELMGENCIQMAFWDVDTADWVPEMTAEEVAQNIIAHIEGGTYVDFKKVGNRYVKNPVTLKDPPLGGIILQHDVQQASVNGLENFLRYAEQKEIILLSLDDVDEFTVTKNCSL